MTDQNMADDAYQPSGGNEEQEDAAPLDLQDAVGEPTYDELLDAGYSPPERPLGVDRKGTTASEQHEGETLDERLRQEVPDVTAPQDGTSPEEAPAEDYDAGGHRDGGAVSAEESAVHVVPDQDALPPGRT